MDRQIDFAEKQILAGQAAVNCPLQRASRVGKLKWTGSTVAWVELVYALYESGLVNNGKTTLKNLFHAMGDIFDFHVDDFSRTFTDIKNRAKGDRTAFIDELKRGLMRRLEEADRKPPRK